MNDLSVSDPKQAERKPIRAGAWGCVLISLLAMLLFCAGSLWAVNGYATRPNAGLPATLCVGMVFTPRFQLGLTWDTALSSRISPLVFSHLAGCMNVPAGWLPGYSQYWLWPP